MNKYASGWLLILLLLVAVPVGAQYRDNLGGNWNNRNLRLKATV